METDSRQTSGSDAGAFPGFEDLKKLIEKFQLPSVDIDALIDWQRKDMEALTEANRQASEGLKALVERRNEILRETLTEWQAAIKDATSARGDVETGRGCDAGYAEGDGEFPRTFRNGSAGAQQCVEGRAGAHAGEYGKPPEAAATEVRRHSRVRLLIGKQ